MRIKQELRDDLLRLAGKLEALRFPLAWKEGADLFNQAYYDLVDSIGDDYNRVVTRLIGCDDE